MIQLTKHHFTQYNFNMQLQCKTKIAYASILLHEIKFCFVTSFYLKLIVKLHCND